MKSSHFILISAFCISQAQAFDLPRHPTKSYECDVCTKLSHETIQDKWQLANQPLNMKSSNLQKSYGYKQRVTRAELTKGVVIATLAPGAIIRITPLQDKPIPQLQIQTPSKKHLNLKQASSLYSVDEPLDESLLAAKHQTMLQMKPELGHGQFIIKGEAATAEYADTYMINVFDKFSDTHMSLESDAIHYQYGDAVTATITLTDSMAHYSVDDIEAALISPSGDVIDMDITEIRRNKFQATARLNSEANEHGENWYIEASLQTELNDEYIRRNAHTAISYSIPSAALLNVKKISSNPLSFAATVNVATASRYALQSVLFRQNANAEAEPMETSQKAQWLEPGIQIIQFTFDNPKQLSDDNLYLGYLMLTDYGQLKPVYQYNQPIRLTQLVE